MNIYKNARLTAKGREAVVRDVVDLGLTQSEGITSSSHHTKPNPIRHKPTARRSASSKPHVESGPTPPHLKTQSKEKPTCQDGNTDTTGTGPMPAWQGKHQSVRLGITEDNLLKLHS